MTAFGWLFCIVVGAKRVVVKGAGRQSVRARLLRPLQSRGVAVIEGPVNLSDGEGRFMSRRRHRLGR
ncbi:MAG: hypothetical protein IPK83_19600 [Planctomycetes bacterium]|nr:hypothetical protein [Planctomycetota bacterium]